MIHDFRQLNRKHAARAVAFAFGADASAVFFDNRTNDKKSQTGSFGFQRRDAIKTLENSSQFGGRNADAGIFDANDDGFFIQAFDGDGNFHRIARIFDGIVEQIRENRL